MIVNGIPLIQILTPLQVDVIPANLMDPSLGLGLSPKPTFSHKILTEICNVGFNFYAWLSVYNRCL